MGGLKGVIGAIAGLLILKIKVQYIWGEGKIRRDLGTGQKDSSVNKYTLEQNIIKNIGIVSTMIVTD